MITIIVSIMYTIVTTIYKYFTIVVDNYYILQRDRDKYKNSFLYYKINKK
jgi:hypothetical protein